MNYGIRVKNPLTKPVRVEVIDGKTIIRETVINPGAAKFISLDKAGQYDIRTTILDRRVGAIDDELGAASFNVVYHEDVKEPEMKPVLLHNKIDLSIHSEQKTARYWRDILIWRVTPGSLGELMAVEIERRDDVDWRLKVMKPGDGRFGGTITEIINTTTFSGNKVTGGEIIKLQAKNKSGASITVSGRISGRETVVHEGLSPARVTVSPVRVETQPAEEEDDEPVRSMADMFDEMRKEEVAV